MILPQNNTLPASTPDMDSHPTFMDLFCGCGGFTLGMLRAGFHCKAVIDVYHQAIESIKKNFTPPPIVTY
jgi:DNA (cytosine-5)-methyltransferase 1